ncbi:MAG TPA: c-type cytochrome [Flavitalea sp.]|nr:c-type cytochrome [Flavitalea sp.]
MKKQLLKPVALLLALALLLNIFSGFRLFQNKPWPVPENYKNMKNPVASDATSIAEGKALYGTHCKSCHGAKGLGDGNKAAQLKTEPGDFTTADFQGQTDGELFYKTTEGRDDMPNFKKKIPDAEERWSVVHYMRTLKK